MNIWYTSYGSNLCESRFLCYILGLQPKGSTIKERGCKDTSLPKANKKIMLPYQLYFAKEKSKWGKGGVAFIDHATNTSYQTIGRMYHITSEQFFDVIAQENRLTHFQIDLEKVKQFGYVNTNIGWYDRIVYLGEEDNSPIFTFTSSHPSQAMDKNTPSIAYQNIIRKGLAELGIKDAEISNYLSQAIEN